jgi:hypothetical protein
LETLPTNHKIKKLGFAIMILSVVGAIALLAYLNNIYPILNWQLIIGSLAIVTGILLIITLLILKLTAFKENRLVFYAIIINPCLVQIFAGIAGIAAITYQNHKLAYIYFSTGILMVAGIIIGFVVFIAAMVKMKNK